MISTRHYLPKDAAEKLPELSQLASQGLPSSVQWRFLATGPEFRFSFELLPQGGSRFEQSDIERSHEYFPDITDMLRIGSYEYNFLHFHLRSDVCTRTKDGSFWIVNLKKESIVTRFQGNEMAFERIPLFFQFVNSQPSQFETCMAVFLDLVKKSPQPTRDKATALTAWTQFEDEIRQIDPKIFEYDDSFWGCVIGEQVGLF